jgi:toxin ParE1/3/4
MPTVFRPPQVQHDVDQIATYIARDDPPAARRWLANIDAIFTLLSTQPLMGTRVSSRRYGEIRQYSHGNYVIYYRPIDDGIILLRVLHGSRDHRSLI